MKKYLLAIEGGGVRGISSIAFLEALEKDLGESVCKKFDLFSGSSVGALIVLSMTALSYSASEILKHATSGSFLQRLFTRRCLWFTWPFWKPRYKGSSKQRVIRDYFGDVSFTSVKKATLVPAYDLVNQRPLIWKSWDKDLPESFKVHDLVDATTAAPTYFPAVKISPSPPLPLWVSDGSIVANNPSACALVAAISRGWQLNKIRLLSLGTASPSVNFSKSGQRDYASWGGIKWLSEITGFMFDGSEEIAEYQSKRLLSENFFNVQAQFSKHVPIDDISPSTISYLKEKGQSLYQKARPTLLAWLKQK